MLRAAGLDFEVVVTRVDEETLKDALLAEERSAREHRGCAREMKAARVSGKRPEALVLGCDQTLSCEGRLFSSPRAPEEAREQIGR
jgi:septum formation protein